MALAAAAIFGAIRFADDDRERALLAWQAKLGIVADSRAAAVDRWLQSQFSGLTQIANNAALQLYFTQIAMTSAAPDKPDTDIARAGYLRNLLTVIAHRMGFDQPPQGPRVAANVQRIGVAGIALITMDGRVVTATDGMPAVQGRILGILSREASGEARLLDLYLDSTGKHSIGFAAPIFAIQSNTSATDQIGWVVGIKRAASELYPLLRQPGSAWNSAEALLIRQVDAGIEYLSPTKAVDDSPGRIFAADTPRLAAAFALEKPGGFALRRDYQGRDVLLSARKIRAAPWTLYYKIDRAEALGASDERARRLLIAMLAAIVAVIAIIVAAWRHGTSVRAARAAAEAEVLARRYEAQSDFLKLITDSQPAAMFIVDQQDQYKFANRVAADGAGIGEQDLLGKSLASVLGPAAASRYVTLNREVRDTGQRRIEVHQSGSNGDLRVVQSEHIPISQAETETETGRAPEILVVEEDITVAVAEKARRERTLEQLIRTLLAILDRRDPHAVHHSARVAALARAIALEMGLDEEESKTAEIAGQLMNIGKALVPSEMLTRDGDLADEEMQLVRDSLQNGADLLEGIEFDGPVVETLRQIQERWDGSGSPLGLAGEEILVTAQIVAVANAYVALTSERAWRAGTDGENAAGELMKEAGAAFTRRVVSALINLVDNRDLPQTTLPNLLSLAPR
jgi:PAS domain S-box-containing protein